MVDVDGRHAYWSLDRLLASGGREDVGLTPAGISYCWNFMVSVG